jgi:hypothetical protein
VEAWAATEITDDQPGFDWLETLSEQAVEWHEVAIDLLAGEICSNGTARPSAHAFALLPGYLAGLVASHGLALHGMPRSFMLGPAASSGRRSAVCWPPQRLDDEDGPALWTPAIDFHVETVPLHGRPRVHAELSVTRFPLQRVAYVPGHGTGPPSATIWLHARAGFLRASEQPTFVAANVQKRGAGGGLRWRWGHGLARALARLTDHHYPDPDEVMTSPDAYVDAPISAHVLYSGGTTLAAFDDEEADDTQDSPRARSVLHPVRTGFLPIDHLDLHDQLIPVMRPLGIVAAPELKRASPGRPAVLNPVDPPGLGYTLELWTQSETTRQAVLRVLEHLDFVETGRRQSDGIMTLEFTGPFSLTLVLRDAGSLPAGIPRAGKDEGAATTGDGVTRRVREILDAVPGCPDRRAAIMELDDARYFARARMGDPKPALKRGFALTGRPLQCMRPIHEYRPKPDAKRPKPVLPGTRFTVVDARRAMASVQDALRQLGRVGALAPPPGLADPCELMGVWLERVPGGIVPILVRITPEGIATAQIVVGDRSEEMPYADLPRALAEGRGRLHRRSGVDLKAVVSRFLVGVLDIGETTRDRVVFVRSATFRTTGWAWLQDAHIAPDLLVLPGRDPRGQSVERLDPSMCPGLRIIRVRERDSAGEVPRGFGVADDAFGRVSGLFPQGERVFYGVNPRPDQAQAPKALTKLDPALTRNVTVQGWNPNPLEIMPCFLQPGDDPEDWAMYTHALRRAYLHTDIASRLPLPLHLASLADEYLH